MKKIGNKILSLFLAMLLVLGLALVTTYAAGHTDHKVCSKATAHAVGETCSHETITTAQWEPLVIPAVKEGEDYPILESGYYYLAENITTDSNVMLAKDAEVVICLNGKTWNLRSGEYDGSLYLNENVDLKICDCSSTQAGKLDGCVNVYGGNPKLVELYSGEINCLNSASSSSVISTFNMYGGKINIDTMEEEARREWNSRAIYLYGNNSDVNINIYGGTIIGDDAGIYMSKVSSNSALNIYGGTIEGIIYGLELNSDEGIVNICGNANIIGRTRAIVSSRPSNGNGCKLKISGSPTIDGSYGWAAIETYNTIEIEGTPTIRNYVRCYPHPYGDAAEPYPMFRITGAFTPKQAIDVYVEYPNLTIAEGWSNVGSGATVSSYFKASSSSSVSVRSLKVDEANSDQLMAAPSSSSVQAKTNAIAFPNGNTISVQAGDATATLDTLKSYDASRFTVKVYDADKALVNNVGGTV